MSGQDFTYEDFERLIGERRNWGRWGDDDEVGAVNLITSAKRLEAVSLVRLGRTISLSRSFPTAPSQNNPYPAEHYLLREDFQNSGAAIDYYGIRYHGYAATHVDALSHSWIGGRMWNGRKPDEELSSFGSRWGGIENWADGVVTRGVLLDVPAYRAERHVTYDNPVHGSELQAVCDFQGTSVGPGDALLVYSGRDQWDADPTNPQWGGEPENDPRRPGLHASCLEFIRDYDVAVLAWDMMDSLPNDWGLRSTVHVAISAFGVALVDNCEMSALVAACRAAKICEVMFVLAPLVVPGGTGSPVNPLAIL